MFSLRDAYSHLHKMLLALGVQQHVDLQIVFSRYVLFCLCPQLSEPFPQDDSHRRLEHARFNQVPCSGRKLSNRHRGYPFARNCRLRERRAGQPTPHQWRRCYDPCTKCATQTKISCKGPLRTYKCVARVRSACFSLGPRAEMEELKRRRYRLTQAISFIALTNHFQLDSCSKSV